MKIEFISNLETLKKYKIKVQIIRRVKMFEMQKKDLTKPIAVRLRNRFYRRKKKRIKYD